MAFRHKPRDVKTDPHPGERRGPSGPTDERMAEPPEVLFGNADPVVRDRDLDGPAVVSERNADLTSVRLVLHRVTDEVHQELLDA